MSQEIQIVDGGYYLESIRGRVGTGDTTRDSEMKNYYRCSVINETRVRIHLLDNNDEPTGYSEEVEASELAERFEFLPDFKPREKADPKKERSNKICSRAERHMEKEEYLSAEFEYNKALALDEQSVRANFGMGQTYLAQGEPDKAKEVFKKLANIEAITEPRHKHIFNEFGMQLRKLGLFEDAVRHYSKALKISPDDENLWFNLGRALWESGDKPKASNALSNALRINPNMTAARQLLEKAYKGE